MDIDPGSISVILRGVAYHIDEIAPIERIPALAQDPEQLAAFKAAGHGTYAHSDRSLVEQAVSSARKTLAAANLSVRDIDAVVLGTSEIREPRYPEKLSTDVMTALELRDIPVTGVTLAGCANYSSSLRVARNMIIAEGLNHVLVIETDQVRGAMERQFVSSFTGTPCAIFGDGAASLIASADYAVFERAHSPDFELIAMAQTVLPIDTERVELTDVWTNNVVGFRKVMDEVFERAGAVRTDFRKIFLSNIGIELVYSFVAPLELPPWAVHTVNCSRTAHVWSCDNLINLADYCAAEEVPVGALFLLLCQAESYYSAIVCRRR
jgi:3-oxoacyl-[acyl-carrier-protein] synthase III